MTSLSLAPVVLAWTGLVLAAIPAVLTAVNLMLYRRPPRTGDDALPAASVLIPARDEEERIGRSVRAALGSRGVEVEVLVMDDGSTDRTAEIVREISRHDGRVRLLEAPPLPPGWAGKQHACQALADAARNPVLVFVDADVELRPDGVAGALRFLRRSGADLVSGFPRQRTGTPVERLVIPLIHFVLLGYLPLAGMRWTRSGAFAAGCGQLFVARRFAYEMAGGHAAIRHTFHDGLELPRLFRRRGLRTDLFDATATATCRMYEGAREVVLGLAKNAHEGMAGPVAIWVWSVLLVGGHALPPLLAVAGLLWAPDAAWTALAVAGTGLGLATRLALALRFRQSLFGALLHPVGVVLLVGIQWYARLRRRAGRAVTWKDRVPADA